MRTSPRVQLFAAAVAFGLMAVLTRLSMQGEEGLTFGQVTLIRFILGVAACGAIFALRPGTFRPVNRRLLVTRGLLGGAAVLLYFAALGRIHAGTATLLNSTFPVMATVIRATMAMPSMMRSTATEASAAGKRTPVRRLAANARANSPARAGRMLFAMKPMAVACHRGR